MTWRLNPPATFDLIKEEPASDDSNCFKDDEETSTGHSPNSTTDHGIPDLIEGREEEVASYQKRETSRWKLQCTIVVIDEAITIVVIDEAIDYLRSFKVKAKGSGLHEF
ncbi:Hypothetical predicted protein [Olea europaea subsp. europaea]|uniref:Uncharacterized protein n=1 Tax=Olea europaea subsp. europaea TaxID=158383 RepID=A0A8S0VN53_OLEEU|nr:Hypothetical predicted protein [Olea europaea subsp. europaea]